MPQMILKDMQFFANTELEMIESVTVQAGSPLTLNAIDPLILQDSQTQQNKTYEFLFWDVAGQVISTPTALLNTTPSIDFTASAWYLLVSGGGGPPTVNVFAFAADKDRTLSDNPILSVAPTGDWSGGNTVDTSNDTVSIIPKPSVPGDPGAVFDGWVQRHGTVAAHTLTVLKGVSELAIAIYGADPCQAFRDGVAEAQAEFDACASDPGCPKSALIALGKRLRLAEAQLQTCEQQH
jgi:hypothetical protein